MFRNQWRLWAVVPSLALGAVVGFVASPLTSSWTVAASRCVDAPARPLAASVDPSSGGPQSAPEQSIHLVLDNVQMKTKDQEFSFKIKKMEFEYKGLEIKADSCIKASLDTKGDNQDVTKCTDALTAIAKALTENSVGKKNSRNDDKETGDKPKADDANCKAGTAPKASPVSGVTWVPCAPPIATATLPVPAPPCQAAPPKSAPKQVDTKADETDSDFE